MLGVGACLGLLAGWLVHTILTTITAIPVTNTTFVMTTAQHHHRREIRERIVA